MMNTLRQIYFFVVGWLISALWGGIALVGQTIVGGTWVLRAEQGWGRWVMRACGIRVKVSTEQDFDLQQHYVYACNHQSLFDILALGGFLPQLVGFVAKKELRSWPIVGWAIKQAGYVLIDRSAGRQALKAMRAAGETIRNNNSIVIFPEGTRSPNGELRRFKRGALVLARAARVPIVPVAIVGSGDRLPKGSWKVTPGEIGIHIGQPIPYAEFATADDFDFTEKLRAKVAELAGESMTKVHKVSRPSPNEPADMPPEQIAHPSQHASSSL